MKEKIQSVTLAILLLILFVVIPILLIRPTCEQKQRRTEKDSLIDLKLKLEIQVLKNKLNK